MGRSGVSVNGQNFTFFYSDFFFFLLMSLMAQHQVDHGRQHLNSREKTMSFIQYLKYDFQEFHW